MRVALFAVVLAASAAVAQPVAPSLEAARVVIGSEPPVGARPLPVQGPSRAPYWTGVAVDGVALVGGAVVAYQGLRIMDAGEDMELVGVTAILVGGVITAVGTAAALLGGYDLVRVAGGDDPALARLFDSDRLPYPPGGPPLVPPR